MDNATAVAEQVKFANIFWELALPLIFIAADVVTGWIQACINHTVDSTKMRAGLFRKSMEILILFLAVIAGKAVILPFDIAVIFAVYICLMEAVSVMENANQAGVPIPAWIMKALKKIQEQMNGDDKKEK